MVPQEVATSNKHQLSLEHIVFPVPQQKKKTCSTLLPIICAICCRSILLQQPMLAAAVGLWQLRTAHVNTQLLRVTLSRSLQLTTKIVISYTGLL